MDKRLDILLVENFGIGSRTKAQELIAQNLVLVNGKAAKASTKINENDKVEILQHKEYVSRGAYKLLGGIENFKLDFAGKVVLDAGASTGGWTQVAIENGASKVYAVDVGRGELDKTLATNPKVINMEGRDIRSIKLQEVEDVDIVIGDLSFISLTKILPHIKQLFKNIECVFLFKPQFECGREIAKKYKGVIKNKEVHIKLLNEFVHYAQSIDYKVSQLTYSSITGGDGNIEYLLHFNAETQESFDIAKLVNTAFEKFKK